MFSEDRYIRKTELSGEITLLRFDVVTMYLNGEKEKAEGVAYALDTLEKLLEDKSGEDE